MKRFIQAFFVLLSLFSLNLFISIIITSPNNMYQIITTILLSLIIHIAVFFQINKFKIKNENKIIFLNFLLFVLAFIGLLTNINLLGYVGPIWLIAPFLIFILLLLKKQKVINK